MIKACCGGGYGYGWGWWQALGSFMRLRTGLTGKRRHYPPPRGLCSKRVYMRKSPKCTPGRTRRPVCQKVPIDGGDQATGADPGAIVDPCRVVGFP